MKLTKSQLRKIIREELQEAYSVDIDKLLQNPKIKKLMKRLDIKKSQSQDAAIKVLNYFAVNPSALVSLRRIAFETTTTAAVPGYQTPFAFKKKEDDDELNESPYGQARGWSNVEAKKQVDDDIRKMSKILGSASHNVIKIMMGGVKDGRYDALDLSRGIDFGDVTRTHEGERDFLRVLWRKIRDKFRKYIKRGKLR